MNINGISNVASRFGGRALFKAQKYAPQILTAVGIAGSITSTVLAVKATTKLETVLDEHENRVSNSKKNHVAAYGNVDTTKLNKSLTKEYARTGLKLTKLYGPSIGVGVLSYTSIVCGHGIMMKRQTALLAAYATVERTLKEYRKRVELAVGPEKEVELYHDITLEKGKDADKNNVIGIKGDRPKSISGFSVFFDEYSPSWSKDPEQNKFFLTSQQNWFNDKLQRKGHVFLNEVHDALGLDRTKAGQAVGWFWGSEDGDNYIDFGIFRDDAQVRQFVNGREVSILLDFNVDGPILDKL